MKNGLTLKIGLDRRAVIWEAAAMNPCMTVSLTEPSPPAGWCARL